MSFYRHDCFLIYKKLFVTIKYYKEISNIIISEHTSNELLTVWVMGILISIVLSLLQYFKWPLILESVEKKKDLAPGSNQVARSTSLTAPDSNNMESFLRSLADNKTQSVTQPLIFGISETIALFLMLSTSWKIYL